MKDERAKHETEREPAAMELATKAEEMGGIAKTNGIQNISAESGMKKSQTLQLMAALAALSPGLITSTIPLPRGETINRGRREEKDELALQKAQAKRDRKALNRKAA